MKGAEFLHQSAGDAFRRRWRAPFALPAAGPYVLKRARVLGRSLPEPVGPLDFDGFAIVDILVDEDAIAKIAPHGAVDFGETPEVAMSGRIVLPLFVDVHTHLDKGHIWRRKRNPVGDFPSAVAATVEDRSANWSAADVAARMEFSLRCAYAHGTTAIRTHIDSVGPQTRISWPVLAEARERWRGRIDLQASPLFTIDHLANATHVADIEAMLDAYGSGILGAAIRMEPDLRDGLSVLFELAERKGWELDFHVDESSDPAARSLKVIADVAIERRFARPILVGHCCSLALQEDDERQRTIDAVARARLKRRVLADVQHVPSGSPGRPHAALARRHRAARTETRRGQRDDRERQHPRSVLPVWRPGHDGSVARGRSDLAP